MAKDIKEITEQLEQGVKGIFESGRYEEYLRCMSKFYHYSTNNCVLILMQKPEASLVAGYQSWQKNFGRQVRKGETGIKILAPCPHKVTKEVKDADGNTEEQEIKWTSFRAVTVFDVSQTDGKEIPELLNRLEGTVDGYKGIIDKLFEVSPVPVVFEKINGSANGFYSFTEKKIAIREGISEQQTVKTLIHEIAHSILHDRENGEEKDADRETKEVQAESVAYTVCNTLGLDTSEYSFGYIAGWSKGKEVKELTESMEVIRKTAQTIIEGLQAA